MILGIDEVGRGAWAGPLVVGAVVLGDARIDGLTDSKVLCRNRREEYSKLIHEHAAAIGLGWVSAEEIDEIGLGAALRLATKRAVQEVQRQHVEFHEIIIDGTINFLSDTPLADYVTTMKKADLLIASVSAASIVAKVARDEFMYERADEFVEYGFVDHVGYGTAKHRTAIDQHGVTPLHRLSIAPLQKYASTQKTVIEPVATQPTTRDIGNASETAAAEYLQSRGYEIIDRNWRTKFCEIDIVARKDDVYYFVEVKHRKNADSGDGLAAITPKKLAQMKKAAELYGVMNTPNEIEMQLAVIATQGESSAVITRIEFVA